MTNPPPTVFAVETDSAWVVILAVSLVTLGAALAFRRLIGRPGGLSSAVLLALPLLLPVVAAVVFASAALPELSVLRPASPTLLESSSGLLHLLQLHDGQSNVVTLYALTGSAGSWMLLLGGVISGYMLVRRVVGTLLLHRLIRRSAPPAAPRALQARRCLDRVVRLAGMSKAPELLVLPDAVQGAFAVGGRRPRILMSTDVMDTLTDDELEATLAHEVAHIEAHDVPVIFVAGFLRDLVAWNPLAHMAYRRLTADREIEADRRAAALTGRPLDVASGIVKVCELVKRSRRQRFALALVRRRGGVSRRVSGLLALADGRLVSQPRAGSLYACAALVVAALGLQAGAAVADQGSGALAIVWGSPPIPDRTELWAPKTTRQHHGVAQGKHRVDAPRRAQPRTARRAFRYPEFETGVAMRERNLPRWVRWMSREVRRVPPASLRWEGRQDWTMVPLVTSGMGVRVYRLDL